MWNFILSLFGFNSGATTYGAVDEYCELLGHCHM